MKRLLVMTLALMLMLTGCYIPIFVEEGSDSFVSDPIYSYDHRYFAIERVVKEEWPDDIGYVRFIYVDIFDAENDELIFTFSPARARDYQGTYWETDSYTIWADSGDVGYLCYEYKNGKWVLNEDRLSPPADIVPRD